MPTSLAVSPLTPMLRHYLEVKAQHPDAILLYRMGDFYELFYEDAVRAAPILEVTLTARQKGTDNEAPMCGVPHHAIQGYIGKLLRAGLKVAICDQVEDPATAKGLVRREVTRVVTPGTISEPGLLDGKEDNLLVALEWDGPGGAGAFLDVSTGAFFARRWAGEAEALEDLQLLRPREALFVPGALPATVLAWTETVCPSRTPLDDESRFDAGRADALLQEQFGAATLRGYGFASGEPAVRAAAAALGYARSTQHSPLSHVRGLALREAGTHLVLDATTLANLEVFQARDGGRRGSLLGVLDRTVTAAGGRLLRDWLRRPLRDPGAIGRRLQAVGELLDAAMLRSNLRERLGRIADLERLLGRAVLGTLLPREVAALRDSLDEAPVVLVELRSAHASLLKELASADPLEALRADLAQTLLPAPAASLDDGGVIADGLDPELDRSRSLARDSKRHILALEVRERERSGIPSLKIRYNRVFGYYLEVSKANSARVPADYIRKQTLVNAERYVTPEIKELEEQILSAEERQLTLEREHYTKLLERIAAAGGELSALAHALAALDTVLAFAEAAARGRYAQPRVRAAGEPMVIRDGRHPVVEALAGAPFVPNDTELDGERAQIVVLTGPNMGGKSTYLRQVALIALMAQAGSFVPAASAELGAVDRIFTRVGAGDDLARGESTFMVEMIETANILRNATADSLVILDEVGRGTATFDGLSLAWAIVEHLHQHARPKTLFATHYHELTELAALLPRVVNRTMAVKEWEDRIVFLRRVVPGSADKSYGLHVARLAGLPESVIARAGEILTNLESQEYDVAGKPMRARGSVPDLEGGPAQLQLFSPPSELVAKILADTDVEQLTPLAALNLLHALKARLS